MNVAARLLAYQNVPGAVVVALRQQGHNIGGILEDAPGSPDPEVLERAQQDGRVLVTCDKDFGELAFRRGLAASVGIVLFRITLTSTEHAVRVAVAAFATRAEWAGQFAVVEASNAMPGPPSEQLTTHAKTWPFECPNPHQS